MSYNYNLTFSEKERLAYISGDVLVYQSFADCEELQSEIDEVESLEKAAYDDGFIKGQEKVLGVNSVETIADLTHDLNCARKEISVLRDQLNKIAELFHSEGAKTVAGRKILVESIRQKVKNCAN